VRGDPDETTAPHIARDGGGGQWDNARHSRHVDGGRRLNAHERIRRSPRVQVLEISLAKALDMLRPPRTSPTHALSRFATN
jgi:hypothetical protein